MKKKHVIVATLSGLVIAATAAWAQAPFGGPEDVKYSQALWKALTKANFVGSNAIMSTPYTGQHPHGAILDTIDGTVKVKGDTGRVIVKRNYGGEGVSKQAVANNPGKYLKAVTVMFKRSGYDADNKDWFWVKFKPDGGLHTNPKGMQLAGRVAKGKAKGCIACHKAAPGGDYIFNFDR
ncbi:MAG: cytochrome P460 family protein [Acidiferrobacterales bacterium]